MVPDTCGDGYKKSTEECEDGNVLDGDGCDSACTIELNYQCDPGFHAYDVMQCHPICGDGVVVAPETCDDPSDVNCVNCKLMVNFCGDAVRDLLEGCDDGNTENGDGCNDRCEVELGWTCKLVIGGTIDTCSKCVY